MQTATKTPSKIHAAPRKSTSKKAASTPILTEIAKVHLVPIDLIDTPEQIRTEFDQGSIKDLARDIQERGLLQPILLNPIGDRFQLIASERRLRAVKLNGSTDIPALQIKASTQEIMLMQLAENIQREQLSLEEECRAISMLYLIQGSLDKVATTVKKSKAWCSKRYAMTQKGLHYLANNLLSEGITEDIELLKALSDLINLVGWANGNTWADKVRESKAGRNEIRAALKATKATMKVIATEKSIAEKVSHAKTKTPPPPPPWTIKNALGDLQQAMTCKQSEFSAADLALSYTLEQQNALSQRLNDAAQIGREEGAFKKIAELIIHGVYDTNYTKLDLLAMIAGNKGIEFDWLGMLSHLQIPREKA